VPYLSCTTRQANASILSFNVHPIASVVKVDDTTSQQVSLNLETMKKEIKFCEQPIPKCYRHESSFLL